jgi:hypothetical protein
MVGPVLFALALIGIFQCVIRSWWRREVEAIAASLVGLLLSVWTFHSLIAPVSEPRHMIPAAAPIIGFAVAALRWLIPRLERPGLSRGALTAAAIAVTIFFFITSTFSVMREIPSGAAGVVASILEQQDWRNDVVLVSSQARTR